MSTWHFKLVGWPWWVVLPLAALLVAGMAKWVAPELAPQPVGRKRALLGLRLAAVGLLTLLWLEPTVSRTGLVRALPRVVLLVDASGSMDIREPAASPTTQLSEAVALRLIPASQRPTLTNASAQARSDARLVAQMAPASPLARGLEQWRALTRFERALRLTTTRLLPVLTNHAQASLLGFDTRLTPLDPEHPPALRPGSLTDFEDALTALAQQGAQDDLGAVLLISDGRQTAGGDPLPVVRGLRARGILVGTVRVGDTAEPPDAVVAEVQGTGEVFLGEEISLDVKFRITGDDQGAWDLVVRQNGKETTRRRVHGNGAWQFEHFQLPAKQAGVSIFQARLERRGVTDAAGVAGGAPPARLAPRFVEASLANNQAEFTVTVNQDPIRVYLADSTPRWESRYLAAMFERDRRVRLARHYHSILGHGPGVSLLPKTLREWDQEDLVILGDLDSSELPAAQQQNCLDFVAKRGGFLVCVAGPRGMPRSFSLGGLARVLPVTVVSQTQRDTAPVTLSLTDEGRVNPITLVLMDPALNQRLWPALPPLQWIASAVTAKPGATVLLEAQNPVRTPVVALQRYGAGRVLWMGTGESWRWRDRIGNRVHQTFWLQALRWGLAARLRGRDPRLQVSLDHSLVGPGESAELRGRATLADGGATAQPLRVRLEHLDAHGKVTPDSLRLLEMQPIPNSDGMGQVTLDDLPEGPWRITITSPHPALAGLSEVRDLLVRASGGRETTELSADAAALGRLAAAGGYTAGGFDQAERMVQELAVRLKPRLREQVQTYRLWDNYPVLAVVAGLLSLEWLWRKRAGLP